MSDRTVLEDLIGVVGEDHCLVDAAAQARYLSDFRHLFHGRAVAVVKPADVREVAAVVAVGVRHGRPVVPHGGNTGLCGGTAPSPQGRDIVLSLERLNRIRSHDLVNNTVTVEAGCVLQALQDEARSLDRFFPLSLGAEGSCQIGGNVATNAGGNSVLRYGNTRDLVLGLEAVLPSGTIFSDLRGLRKNNTGYDLKQIFIGSEGTLGIVTAVTLKLFPARRQVETAFVALASLEDVLAFYVDAREHAEEFLSAFELVPRLGVDMGVEYVPGTVDPLPDPFPFYVLVELSSSQTLLPLRTVLDGLLERNFAAGRIADGTIAGSMREAQALWRVREACIDAQRLSGPSFKHDVAVPLDAIPSFIVRTTAEIARRFPAVRVVASGHVGDGNIHFNVVIGKEQEPEEFLGLAASLEAVVYDRVAEVGGSFSAEHGIGLLKRHSLRRYAQPLALELMEELKGVFDPAGILNPGKVLPVPAESGVRRRQHA